MTLDPKWTDTVDDGVTNTDWDAYDSLIQGEVADYNKRLGATPHFATLDWKMFKAMLWVESGGPQAHAWTTRPMQIGNPHDPGLAVVRGGTEGADLIVSDKLKEDLKGSINQPALNIRAGIAYALTRLALTDIQSVDDPKDTAIRDYTVVKGDSLDRIAHQQGSTIAALQKLNPTVKVLHPGQKISVRKASLRRVITGWLALTSANLAQRYNVGDLQYREKLDYVLALFGKLKR